MTMLFAYGTLMEARVFELVTGSRPHSRPATLTGYRRHAFTGQVYPGIIPAARHEFVEGVVISNISEVIWRRLDDYESNMYERREVTVSDESNAELAAQTYIVAQQYRHLLAEHDWDYAEFLDKHLAYYLQRHGDT